MPSIEDHGRLSVKLLIKQLNGEAAKDEKPRQDIVRKRVTLKAESTTNTNSEKLLADGDHNSSCSNSQETSEKEPKTAPSRCDQADSTKQVSHIQPTSEKEEASEDTAKSQGSRVSGNVLEMIDSLIEKIRVDTAPTNTLSFNDVNHSPTDQFSEFSSGLVEAYPGLEDHIPANPGYQHFNYLILQTIYNSERDRGILHRKNAQPTFGYCSGCLSLGTQGCNTTTRPPKSHRRTLSQS